MILKIPSTFTGTTVRLDVIISATWPMTGPPAGTLYEVKTPSITAGQSITINGDATGYSGAYYVVGVLYMQGGGAATYIPVNGVDYEAHSASTFTFNGKSIDLGTLTLTLAGSDGG